MCFIWTLGLVAWINLLLQYKQRAKPKMGGINGCTPRPDQSIHTNTAQFCRMLPDGDYGNFRGKRKKKSFCKLGAYIYVCIWQSCRPYQSKMLHLEWHSSKISLCFYLPTAHSLLELRACLGFGAVEPSTSCNMKKKTVFLTERGNSRRLRGMCRA